MRIDLLTREFPPFVYGGAGVHVTELAKVLRKYAQVRVHAFDGARRAGRTVPDLPAGIDVCGYDCPQELAQANPALKTMGTDLLMAQCAAGADIVHSHTWYANFAGHLAGLLHGIPHVISAHSLEPLRPWKEEQLGGGYRVSSWIEKAAYENAAGIVAVSRAMKDDILRCYPGLDPKSVRVIHNGIDLDTWKAPQTDSAREQAENFFRSYGLDPRRPTVIFVGRITRQKGVPWLLRALRKVDPGVQVILCAGAADTPRIAQETRELVARLKAVRKGVVWIEDNLTQPQILALEVCSTVFVTPSVYEPLGIVNLEAMGAGLPVVGTATGGIPDCIEHEKTGLLVPIEQLNDGTGTPLNPEKFESDLAAALNRLCADRDLAREYGAAGRKRVEKYFSWSAIAVKTMDFYRSILG